MLREPAAWGFLAAGSDQPLFRIRDALLPDQKEESAEQELLQTEESIERQVLQADHRQYKGTIQIRGNRTIRGRTPFSFLKRRLRPGLAYPASHKKI